MTQTQRIPRGDFDAQSTRVAQVIGRVALVAAAFAAIYSALYYLVAYISE